ncbi:fasciclin-like arabinogalactan protein 12 [Mangifera indica]|uniref:fasciclin-like arabinogalactan protein 12 n=1 Tax=Mangifera indica TaxID=29780 RepID=UPI001CFA3597|nr:fasciclin-like arabinogalactan protein 12 [Mangifera indica]
MMKQSFFSFSLLLFLLLCTSTQAQRLASAPAAPTPPTAPTIAPTPPSPMTPIVTINPPPIGAPIPSGPTNVTKILEKAGRFSLFIRLLKSTTVINQIEHQINSTNGRLTIFAPTDGAFSSLSSGTLNSLTDPQKESLIQFHVISSYISLPQFQTVSNPLRTNAGDNSRYRYQLNATAYPNSVNISTGLTNTSVSAIVYSDGQLAIYQVDKVLLPWEIFGAKPPATALAPAPEKPKKEKPPAVAFSPDDSQTDAADASGAVSLIMTMQNVVLFKVAIVAPVIIFYLI